MLLDFLTKPRFSATQQAPVQAATYEPPAPDDGLLRSVPEALELGAPEPMQQAPPLQERPGLLSQALDFAKSPRGMLVLGTALKSASGDDGAGEMAARIGQSMRQQESEAKKLAERAAKNRAFKAAYRDGKFDPQAYLDALEGSDADLTEVADLEEAFAPRRKYIEGKDGIYEIDERTGDHQRIEAFEDDPEVSPGWVQNPDGSWSPVKDGPYDPDYIAKVSGIRREAVTSRPMPRASGGGSGAVVGLPPGFVLE